MSRFTGTLLFAILLIPFVHSFDFSRCAGGVVPPNYTVITDTTYTSTNNGIVQMGSENYSTLTVVGFAYGDTSIPGGYQAQISPFSTTPPYVIQFDFLNQMGAVFDINYTAADLGGVLLINQTAIISTTGSCSQVSSAYINQTLNIFYHCTGVQNNGSVTIEVTNNYGLTTRATRGVTASHEAFHCLFNIYPINIGTATLAVAYNTSDPLAYVTVSLNGYALGQLSGSGNDVFIGIPLTWLNNVSLVDYVSLSPAANETSVNISSSILSYYGGRSPYYNYTVDYQAGQITTADNGTFYATYGHASDFDKLIISISGFFPLLIAVAILLMVWRVGAYWERTGQD